MLLTNPIGFEPAFRFAKIGFGFSPPSDVRLRDGGKAKEFSPKASTPEVYNLTTSKDVVFCYGLPPSERNSFLLRKNRVRIPHPKIDKLACQAQGAGIFAIGEYP